MGISLDEQIEEIGVVIELRKRYHPYMILTKQITPGDSQRAIGRLEAVRITLIRLRDSIRHGDDGK